MKIIALVKRILSQMISDKRTLALMIFAPLIILTLMNLLFSNGNEMHLKVGTFEVNSEIIATLQDHNVEVYECSDTKDIDSKIKKYKLDAFLNMNDDKLNVTYENSQPSKTKQIRSLIQSSISKISVKNLADLNKNQQNVIKSQQKIIKKAEVKNINLHQKKNIKSIPSKIETHYLYGSEDSDIFENITPILIGFFVFFFVFLISGISLLKERTSGTLNKILSTPIKRSELIFGYLIGYGIFAVIQTVIVVLFSIYVLKVEILGSIYLVLLTNIVLAFSALSIGILLSTFANSEFQMMQFIPIIVLPQVFFSGIIPVDTMDTWLQIVARFMPMYYASDALQNIMIKAASFNDIAIDLFVLLIFASIFTVFNIFGLKRYRKV